MLTFVYTAKNAQGQLISGVLDAPDANAVAKALVEKQLYPVKIEQKKTSVSSGNISLGIFEGVSTKQKANIIRQLATLINAGLPVAKALQTLIKQIDKPYIQKIFVDILKEIENGSSLSQAFGRFPKVFNVTDISLIQAGEASGSLDIVLTRMAKQLEKDYALKSKLTSAMIYPSFVLLVVVGVVAVMLMYVMPKMADLYSDLKGDLPAITQFLMGVSGFLIKFWWIVILFTIFFIILARTFIQTPFGRQVWDQTKISIPGLGSLVRKIILARFTRTLGTLMGSGVPVLDSLKIAGRACGNVIYKQAVFKVSDLVQGGKPLSEPLNANPLFPAVVGQMISVGEETGEMDQMLEGLANYYEEEVDNLIKGLSALLEPFIIVVLGVVVGGILVAIMLPIYSLSQVMFKQ